MSAATTRIVWQKEWVDFPAGKIKVYKWVQTSVPESNDPSLDDTLRASSPISAEPLDDSASLPKEPSSSSLESTDLEGSSNHGETPMDVDPTLSTEHPSSPLSTKKTELLSSSSSASASSSSSSSSGNYGELDYGLEEMNEPTDMSATKDPLNSFTSPRSTSLSSFSSNLTSTTKLPFPSPASPSPSPSSSSSSSSALALSPKTQVQNSTMINASGSPSTTPPHATFLNEQDENYTNNVNKENENAIEAKEDGVEDEDEEEGELKEPVQRIVSTEMTQEEDPMMLERNELSMDMNPQEETEIWSLTNEEVEEME